MDGYGVMAEEDYPYAKGSGLGQFCAYDPYRVKVNVTGCEKYKLTSEYDVMKVLYERGPLSVCKYYNNHLLAQVMLRNVSCVIYKCRRLFLLN